MALYNEILNLFSKKKKKKNEEGGARNSTASFSDKKQKENKSASAPMTFQQSITTGKNTVSNAIANEANKRKSTSLADIGTGAGAKNGVRKGWEGKDSSDIAKSVVKYGEVVHEQREKRKDLYQKTLKETGSIQSARKAVDDAEGYVNTRSEGYNKLHNLAHGMGETTAYGVSGAVDSAANIVGAGANAAQAVYNIPYDIMRRNKANIETMLRKDKLDVPEGMDEASYRAILENQLNRIDDEMNTYNTNGIVGSNAVNDVQNAISGYANDIRQANSDDGGAFVTHARNVAQNVGNNIANMTAGAAISAVTGGAVNPELAGLISLGVGAYGNATGNALQQTGNEAAARYAANVAGNNAIDNAKLQEIYDAVLKRTGDQAIAMQYAQKAAEEMYDNAAESAYAQSLRRTGDPIYSNVKGILGAGNELLQERLSPFGTSFEKSIPTLTNLGMEGVQEGVGALIDPWEDALAYNILGGDYAEKGKQELAKAKSTVKTGDYWKDVGKQALGGIESAAILGGITHPVTSAYNVAKDVKNGADFITGKSDYTRDEAVKRLQADIDANENLDRMTGGKTSDDTMQAYRNKAMYDARVATVENLNSNDYGIRKMANDALSDMVRASAKSTGANISDKTIASIIDIAKAGKIPVQFENGLTDGNGKAVDGMYDDGVIKINTSASADNLSSTVFAHELTHALQSSDNYDSLSKSIRELAESGAVDTGYKSVDDLQNAIQEAYEDITPDELNRETTAFIAQKIFGNNTALTELAENNSSLAGRISSWIDNTIGELNSNNSKALLSKTKNILNKALSNRNAISEFETSPEYAKKTLEQIGEELKPVFTSDGKIDLWETFKTDKNLKGTYNIYRRYFGIDNDMREEFIKNGHAVMDAGNNVDAVKKINEALLNNLAPVRGKLWKEFFNEKGSPEKYTHYAQYIEAKDKEQAIKIIIKTAREYADGKFGSPLTNYDEANLKFSEELDKQFAVSHDDANENPNSVNVKGLTAYQQFVEKAGKETAHQYLADVVRKMDDGQMTLDDAKERFIDLTKKLKQANKTQAVKEKTGKKQSKAKSAKETKAGEAKVEESTADAVTRMNAEKQEQAAKNAKKSHEFFQNVKEAEAAKAKAQQEEQGKQEKAETEKQRAKRLAKEERDKARAERQAAKDAEAKAKAEETAFKKNYSNLGNDKFSGVPVTLRNDFKWSAQKFIKTRTSTISSALPEGTSEETKTAIFNNVKYKALTDYKQESFNALKNNTDVSEEAKSKAVDDVVKILKDNGVEKLNEVKGKSFDNLEDAVRNILFPPRGGARKAKTAKTAEQQEQEIFDQTMNQPKVEQQKVEKPKAKKAKTEKPKAPVVETKAEKVKAPVVEKVEQPKVETAEQQEQEIFDKTVNNIEKKNPYKVKVTPENRQAIIDKVEKYKADFVQRLVDLGAERDVSERLAQKIAETGKWKANSADVSIENDNDRATAWHQIEKANPNYKTEDIKKWFADAMKLIPSEYRNIGLYDNPTYWVNKRAKVDDTKPASAQAKLLTDAGISGELANETVNAILNKTGGKDGNKATWAKGTYNDLMAAVANKEGLNLKDDADKQKVRDILGGLKRQVIDQLTKNGWKTTKAEPAKAETVQADTKTPTKATIPTQADTKTPTNPTTAKSEDTVVSQMRDLFKSGMLNADGTFSNNEAKSEQYKRNITDEVADDYANRLRDQIDRLKEQVGEKTAQNIAEGALEDAKAKANGEVKTPTQVQEEQAQEDLSKAIGGVPKDQIKVNQWQKRQGYTDSSDKTDIENAKAIRRQNNNENIASGKYVIRHIQEFNDKADQLIDTLLKDGETLKEKDVDDKVIGLANKYLSSNNTSDLAGEKAPAWKKLKNSFSYSDDAMMFAVGNKVKDLVAEGEKSIVDQLRDDGIDATFISIGAGEDGRMIDRAVLYELDENGNVKVNEKGEKIKVKGEEYDKVVQSLNDYHRAMFQINEKMAGLTNNAGTVLRLAVENAQNSPAACFNSMMDRLENIQKQVDKKNKGNVDIAGTIRAKYEKKWADADEAGRVKLMSEIATEAGEMMPTTTKEKMDSWRMMMMLVNPTTHIRNVLGNLMMQGAVSMKNLNYRVIQSAVEKNGNVQEHEFIPRNNSDKNLLANVNTSLEKYGTETMKRWQEGKFKASGELADELKKNFSSANRFRFINSEAFRDRVVNELAYQMRDAKTQENSGVFENEQMDEMFNKAYNLASKKWLQRSDLRTGNRYGLKFEKGELSKTGDILSKYYDEHLKEDTNIIDSKTGKGLDGKVYQAHSKKIFNQKVPDAISSANNKALSFEDTFVMKGRYVSSMKQILTAQGYKLTGFNKEGNPILTEYNTNKSISRERSSEIFNRISEMALQEAKESAYHDANKLADLLNEAAQSKWYLGVLADSVLPFIKTPMNITRRMVEYSPLWFINAAKQYQNVQNGTVTSDQFINSMAKAMTGTEVVMLGMMLKHLGFLRGTGDDDDDDSKVKKFENELGGKQDYSLVLPNGATYTLGWLAPISGPLFVGVQIMSELEDMWHGDEFDLWEVAKSSIAPILDSSFLSGIQNSIDTANNYVNYGYQVTPNGKVREASFLEGLMIGALQNYVAQYSPAVGGKFVKAATGKDLDTFSPNVVEKMYRTAASKEIFLYMLTNYVSQQKTGHDYLLPRVNSNGEEMESTGGNLGGRFAYQMLSPGSYKKDRRDNVDNELERLYKSTKQDYLLPSQLYRLGDQSLNGYDKYAYNKNVLSSEKKSISEFVNSASYQDYTDPERAQIIRQIRTGAYHDAEEKYRKENGLPMEGSFLTESDKARNAIMNVSNKTQGSTFKEWQYYAIKNMKNDVDEDGNQIYNSKAVAVRNLYEKEGVWDGVKKDIASGKIKAGSAGMTSKIAGMTDAEFSYYDESGQLTAYDYSSSPSQETSKYKIESTMKAAGVSPESLYKARYAKSDKDIYGKNIPYSQDINARNAIGEDGIASIKQAIEDNVMSVEEAVKYTGIGKKVLMMRTDSYLKFADDIKKPGEKQKYYGGTGKPGGTGGSKAKQTEEEKAAISMIKKFANAMADASSAQQKQYKKQLETSLSKLQKQDQDIYDEVMSADDLTKKLDLYGIKIKSQA